MVIFCITDCSSRYKYLAADTPKHDTLSKFFLPEMKWFQLMYLFQDSWPQQSVLKKNAAPEFYFSTKRKPKSKMKLPRFKSEFDIFANHADADWFVWVFIFNFRIFIGSVKSLTEPHKILRGMSHTVWLPFIFRITRSLRRIDVPGWFNAEVIFKLAGIFRNHYIFLIYFYLKNILNFVLC